MTAYVGAEVWDGTGTPVMHDAVIVVADGRIQAVGPPDLVEVPRGAEEIRLDGRYVIPGLIDMHVHAERWALARYLAWGVTTVRDAGGVQDSILALRDDVNGGQVDGPRMFVTGAAIDGAGSDRPGAQVVRSTSDARRAVGNRILIDATHVKIQSRVDRRTLQAILEEAQALETPVAAHLGRVDALTAARMGVRVIEHLSGVPEATVRNPATLIRTHGQNALAAWRLFELAWGGLSTAALSRTARGLDEAGVALVPTLVAHETWAHMGSGAFRDSLDLSGVPEDVREAWNIPRLMVRAGLSGGDFSVMRRGRAAQDRFVAAFIEAGGLVVAGTDSPGPLLAPGASLHHELELLVGTGLSPEEALLAATRDAARLLGADSLGVLRAGGAADFVVLNANPFDAIRNTRDIVTVVVQGTRYDPATLRAEW